MVCGFNSCSLFCCAAWGLAGNAGKKMSNARYYTVYLIWMLFCVIFQLLPNNSIVNDNLAKLFGTSGIEIIYRICCALTCSFLLLFLSTLAWPWTHHMFLIVFLVILIFFTWLFIWGIKSNAWVPIFRTVARIGSVVYLILQLMAFVDLSFTLHEIFCEKMDATNKRYNYTDKTCCCANQWKSMYLTLGFLLSVGSVACCIVFYTIFHAENQVCFRNIMVITITMLMGIACLFFCLMEKFNRGLLPPSIFFGIIVFYLVSALLASPDQKCNPFTSSSNYWLLFINIFLNICSGYWMAYRIRSENVDEEVEAAADAEKGKISIPDEDSRQWCVFNGCMVLASLYLAMMVTAWYNGDITVRPSTVFDFTSNTTFWIYNGSIWAGFIVFMYILLIPFINTSRTY